MLSDYTKYRLLEMLPGTLVWLTFISCTIVTFVNPLLAIYGIVIFTFYWMAKVLYLSSFLIVSFREYKATMKVDWVQRCADLPQYHDIFQVIFIPNSSEGLEVVESTFASLAATNFPSSRIIIVFAAEERYPQSIRNGEAMQAKYGQLFHSVHVYTHPSNITGEIAGKGANLAWAGQAVKAEVIDKLQIPYENIIVSVFDVDTCIEPSFFSYLAYTYLQHPNRTHASYQPIAMFSNNIWDAPAIMRVAAMGTTFWLMSEQVRPERLFTFSSHCMSWQALIDAGFWQTDIVSDDSRIFLQCFLQYNGDYEVVPLHMPVYMDTVASSNWWKSLQNLYKQQRRWAWGSENIAYMLWYFWGNKEISLRKRLFHTVNQIEGSWSLATAPLLISVFGYLPQILLRFQADSTSVIVQNAPHILQWFLTIANVGVILSVILGTLMLPHRPVHYKPRKYIMMLLQWFLIPVSMVAFGALPAIDAQTRLLLGNYLGFYVTDKTRKH